MTAAQFITTPSPERSKFFLDVAKRANAMQRALVKKARMNKDIRSAKAPVIKKGAQA